MTERLDCVVIGAGAVGLAVARKLALEGRQVVVLEAEPDVAAHTSSRNSEVIHAGIYYPAGSLKARTCVEGKLALYRYCEERQIPHRRIGKLIVATHPAERPILEEYMAKATANGVTDLKWLSAEDVRAMEPSVSAVGGLFSPSTGIVDSHSLITSLQGDLEAADGVVVCRSRVTRVDVTSGGFVLIVDDDAGFSVSCATLINSAGLWAQDIAALIRGFPASQIPARYLAKGHYFTFKARSPFSHLVYPVAGGGGLGVHVTLDLAGRAKFGPDVCWIDEVDYDFATGRQALFEEAIRRYYPDLADDALAPDYTGIRPKIVGEGMPAADFLIQGPAEHGVPELVNLFGIESPGLTALFAIAEEVGRKID